MMWQYSSRKFMIVPVIGIMIFILLYLAASFQYPGGSQADDTAAGFSWIHNYWCDLLSEEGYNGEPNPGRQLAMAGMLVVCISLATFWILFAINSRLPKTMKITMQVSGIISMGIALFLSTRFHDEIIYISSGFGLVALTLTFIALRQLQWNSLFWFGLLNLAIFFIDHYIYYSRTMIEILPVIQKINFAGLLFWFSLIAIKVYRGNSQK